MDGIFHGQLSSRILMGKLNFPAWTIFPGQLDLETGWKKQNRRILLISHVIEKNTDFSSPAFSSADLDSLESHSFSAR